MKNFLQIFENFHAKKIGKKCEIWLKFDLGDKKNSINLADDANK